MNLNRKLLKVAKYLGSQGLYEEAAQIKKMAGEFDEYVDGNINPKYIERAKRVDRQQKERQPWKEGGGVLEAYKLWMGNAVSYFYSSLKEDFKPYLHDRPGLKEILSDVSNLNDALFYFDQLLQRNRFDDKKLSYDEAFNSPEGRRVRVANIKLNDSKLFKDVGGDRSDPFGARGGLLGALEKSYMDGNDPNSAIVDAKNFVEKLNLN